MTAEYTTEKEGKRSMLLDKMRYLEVSRIVDLILEYRPQMAYYKYPLDAMVRSLIWARLKGISCFRLSVELQNDVNLAFTLNCRSFIHRVDEEDGEINLLINTPTYTTFERFERMLSPNSLRMIQKSAIAVQDEISKEVVEL